MLVGGAKRTVRVKSLQDDWRHGLFDEGITHMLVGGAKSAVKVKSLQDELESVFFLMIFMTRAHKCCQGRYAIGSQVT